MAKKPYRKGRGKCIFCGSYGLTREHIWADWLKAYIPREMTSHIVRHARVSPERPEEVTIQKREGDVHSRRVRCVCAACNSGWMSRLQEAAKPFLVPMLTGKRVSLHRRGQRVLSAWMAMMVTVSEHMNREQVTIPPIDRTWLMEKSEAPHHWRIWIGIHRVQQHPLYSHNSLEMAKKSERFVRGPATAPNTQTSTICVGEYLVFHTMSSIPAWDLIRQWPLPAQIAAQLDQIWPTRTGIVTWPRPSGLTDAGMALLANQFMDAAQRFLSKIINRDA